MALFYGLGALGGVLKKLLYERAVNKKFELSHSPNLFFYHNVATASVPVEN